MGFGDNRCNKMATGGHFEKESFPKKLHIDLKW